MATMIKECEGGVCAPIGYKASGVRCGFRKGTKKLDLGMILSDVTANAAAVYTTNKVCGAPIAVCRRHLKNGKARAVVVNSGNANTCAPDGEGVAEKTCEIAAAELGLEADDFIVASTGVIGERLDIALFEKGIPKAAGKLTYEGSDDCAQAIMTTDTYSKQAAVSFKIGGRKVCIGGIAKGSGMINPKMATMLCFLTSDAAISTALLKKALKDAVSDTFNQLTVDGDTSTNDTVAIMANGLSGNPAIKSAGEDYETFRKALVKLCEKLVRMLARDGEGASKLFIVNVKNAPTKRAAKLIGASVANSPLVKTAVFGEDANWGRIMCALGYSGADFSPDNIEISLMSAVGKIKVCKSSVACPFDEKKAKKLLAEEEITAIIDLNDGEASANAYGCDLTYEYVNINGSYRS